MAATTINVRTDSEVKTQAQDVLSMLGLDLTTAINMFLRQVICTKSVSFNISVAPQRKTAKLGSWEGRGWIADDFNEPMDEYGRFESDPGYCTPVKETWEK